MTRVFEGLGNGSEIYDTLLDVAYARSHAPHVNTPCRGMGSEEWLWNGPGQTDLNPLP